MAGVLTKTKPTQAIQPWQRPAVRAVDLYIAGLGDGDPAKGRIRFLAALLLSPSDDERLDQLLQLAEDPGYKEATTGQLAVACGFRAGEILRIVRDMELVVAQSRGLKVVGDQLKEVVEDIVNRAQRHYIECTACNGTGKVLEAPTKDKPQPTELVPCKTCSAAGKLVCEADPERQQMVLEIAKLVTKGGAQIAIQQNVGMGEAASGKPAGGPASALFDRLVNATDAILQRAPGAGARHETGAGAEEEGADHGPDVGNTAQPDDPDAPLEGEVVVPSAPDA